MTDPKFQKLYDQWKPLVHYIVNKHFMWVVMDTGTGSHQKIRRAIDKDDLISEGILALVDADAKFDPNHKSGSSFKTYAYRVIYNALLNYIDMNCTPITTAHSRNIRQKGSELTKAKFRAATQYANFTELTANKNGKTIDDLAYDPVPSRHDGSIETPFNLIGDQDFKEHCLETIQKALTEEEWRALMLRYSGATFEDIGEKIGLSYESVRSLLEALNYKIRAALLNEIEEFGHGNDTDVSLSHQTRETGVRVRVRNRQRRKPPMAS